jgi:hypothetical protein
MADASGNSAAIEDSIAQALEAVKSKRIKHLRHAARLYDIPQATLQARMHGRVSRQDAQIRNRKLKPTEEKALIQWICSMDERGQPPALAFVRRMADILLAGRGDGSSIVVGENWVRKFLQRNPQLTSKYCRKYDYRRAQCKDPKAIQAWFKRVQDIIGKYGIVTEDIYNFDETGFQMGVASTAKVVTRSERKGRPPQLQPGNKEWVSVIEGISTTGWTLPSLIIFQGKVHQASWYKEEIPKDWSIAVSENGWTDDSIGLAWLKDIFDKHTRNRTVGKYRLLILDGHGSHLTPEFDKHCQENFIIPLCMPPHSSHLLQPLDVSCFAVLKTLYGQQITKNMHLGINHIDKTEFLCAY